jgi:hypothetical protein
MAFKQNALPFPGPLQLCCRRTFFPSVDAALHVGPESVATYIYARELSVRKSCENHKAFSATGEQSQGFRV